MTMELMNRYTEQLTMTVKTIERRWLTLWTDVVRVCNWKSVEQIVEKTRDIVEPALYDIKDYVVKTTVDESPVKLKHDKYNSLVETYLGAAVHLIAVACGQMIGALVLQSLLDRLFSPWADLLLIVLLPVYVHLRVRKDRYLDDVDQRTAVFGLAMALGVGVGHLLGHKIAAVLPAVAFLQPLAIGLLVGLLSHLSSKRRLFVGVLAGFSAVPLLLTAMATQQMSAGFVLSVIAATVLQAVHLQQTLIALEQGSFSLIDAQLGHLIAVIIVHILFAALFGTSTTTSILADDI